MRLRPLFYAVSVAGVMAASAASAATGWATGNVNMRVCPSTGCGKILTIPAGASVHVYSCRRWCEVGYAGRRGFASGRYITVGGYRPAPPRVYVPAVPVPHPPVYRRHYRPYVYDDYYGWPRRYDRRYYRRHRHGGFSFEFHF